MGISNLVVGSHRFIPSGGHQHLEATEDPRFLDLPRQSLCGIHWECCVLCDRLGEVIG